MHRRRGRICGVVFSVASAILSLAVSVAKAEDASANRQAIRAYANGSGPTALFRFGRQEPLQRDVFAVVDPTLWRIQFFTLDDLKSSSPRPFSQRFRKRGDCALPPTFRVWRVHQHDDRIVLQSQPDVPVAALVYSKGPAPIVFGALSLAATQADVDRVAAGNPSPDDDKPDAPCAPSANLASLPPFQASDAAVSVKGGEKKPFTVSRIHAPKELGAFGKKTLQLTVKGRYLVSAQELEFSLVEGAPARHFLVTTRTEKPGFVNTEVVLVRRSAVATQDRRMRINLGLSRVKMGHRNVALATTGEVLVMGTFDKEQFYVQACEFGGRSAEGRCAIEDEETDPLPETEPASPPPPPAENAASPLPPASALWRQAFNYSEQAYIVDLSGLPEGCDRLKKCKVRNAIAWSPLSELRLAEGSAVRKGVPYAQSSKAAARPHFKASDKIEAPIRKPIVDASVVPPFVFGDIENTSAVSGSVHVFGIDCSAFLSHLWGFADVADTEGFITRANTFKDKQIGRVAAIGEAQIGDAFVIRISHVVRGETERLLNHIVLFQEPRPSGPTDSSRAILVVESSSSCGGVCWTFYDESFFHGWGIIRHTQSSPRPQKMDLIPLTVPDWRRMFATF